MPGDGIWDPIFIRIEMASGASTCEMNMHCTLLAAKRKQCPYICLHSLEAVAIYQCNALLLTFVPYFRRKQSFQCLTAHKAQVEPKTLWSMTVPYDTAGGAVVFFCFVCKRSRCVKTWRQMLSLALCVCVSIRIYLHR